jgi:2-polyprenyl-3-methyl-5-hydroxy-6-metoxy-1,4-benzoquinol methylase
MAALPDPCSSQPQDTNRTSQFPYPCIGAFRFLDLSIPQSPIYPEILDRLKSGQKLLDVGCAVGQELRQLVSLDSNI